MNTKRIDPMRQFSFALALAAFAGAAAAQQDTIVLPEGNFGNYDPTLSAREAVLANWELAASGIRAGEVLGEKVVDLADSGAGFAQLARQAAFAQKTMLSRYNAASWVYLAHPDMPRLSDATKQAIVASTSAECTAEDCTAESAAIRAAFAQGAEELTAATLAAREVIATRQDKVDAVIMAEQLGLMADYLESGAWAEDLVLTDYGMDSAVMADRIVGTVALWRNIEPYVGITSPEIDDAINAATQTLLRTLRRETREMERLDPNGRVLAELTAASAALAAELRRAAALFSS
jgi:hypothetical protein